MSFEPTAEQRALLDLVADNRWGVFVTLKRDGTPQLSNVSYGWDAERNAVRVSVTDDRAKTRNLLRDPRASLHVTSADFRKWTVVEGRAELTPVATDPDDAAVRELVDLYRSVAGEHPDWDDFRAAMIRDRRRVVTLTVQSRVRQPRRVDRSGNFLRRQTGGSCPIEGTANRATAAPRRRG